MFCFNSDEKLRSSRAGMVDDKHCSPHPWQMRSVLANIHYFPKLADQLLKRKDRIQEALEGSLLSNVKKRNIGYVGKNKRPWNSVMTLGKEA